MAEGDAEGDAEGEEITLGVSVVGVAVVGAPGLVVCELGVFAEAVLGVAALVDSGALAGREVGETLEFEKSPNADEACTWEDCCCSSVEEVAVAFALDMAAARLCWRCGR